VPRSILVPAHGMPSAVLLFGLRLTPDFTPDFFQGRKTLAFQPFWRPWGLFLYHGDGRFSDELVIHATGSDLPISPLTRKVSIISTSEDCPTKK
jgi:hypothetical protein